MNESNIEKTAKAIEQDIGMPVPDLHQALEAAKLCMDADDEALTKAQINQLKKSATKAKGGKVLNSLF